MALASFTSCCVCKRPLTNPQSIRIGIGPVCLAKVRRRQEATDVEHADRYDLEFDPLTGHIVCRRESDTDGRQVRLHFNIPQLIKYHSPTGMEWGYHGSGPADFALNILYWLTHDRAYAAYYHQEFKREFVAGLPHDGGTIPGQAVRQWIALHPLAHEDGQMWLDELRVGV